MALEVTGQVFAHFGTNPATNGRGPGIYTNPVVGGIVSTSLDGVTATTDGGGRFRLATRANSSDVCFTLTITASGTGPDKLISLSPPQPATASCAP